MRVSLSSSCGRPCHWLFLALVVHVTICTQAAQQVSEASIEPPEPTTSNKVSAPSASVETSDSNSEPSSEKSSAHTDIQQSTQVEIDATGQTAAELPGTPAETTGPSDSQDSDPLLGKTSSWRDFFWGVSPSDADAYPQIVGEKQGDDDISEDKRFMRGFRSAPAAIREPSDSLGDFPEQDKRFMKGFKRDDDKRFMKGFKRDDDKRFMKGFKRDDDKRFMKGFKRDDDKRFMKGFKRDDDKRFMKGFKRDDDKRFMKGFKRDEDKRFMKGFKRDDDKRFMKGFKRDDDKRFMKGFKRSAPSDLDMDSEGDVDKRFMRGFRSDPTLDNNEDKRFMRGFSNYADKRFMRGFRSLPVFEPMSADVVDNEKRFMRGFRSVDSNGDTSDFDSYTNPEEEKRFMRGLYNYDKRFIQGLHSYDKRFIHGLHNYDKRFMRGYVKRDATEENKRFIVGLNGYDRYNRDIVGGDIEKRFIRGFRSLQGGMPDKRFMRGFALYSKKFSPAVLSEMENGDITGEKRFMRGFSKKDSDSQTEEKRFMRGYVKKSDEDTESEDKRFMRGYIKKSDDTDAEKRFMRGYVKKEDDQGASDKDDEKRFMHGYKRDDSEEDESVSEDKRFIKGLSLYEKKETDDESLDANKRFMRGFHNYEKKDSETTNSEVWDGADKRFMRGYIKKDDGADKRFMRGFAKKEHGEEDKRFIKGLQNYAKKDVDEDKTDGVDVSEDKRFMRGYVKKDEDNSGKNDDKRFMRGFSKKEDDSENKPEDKRFIKGLEKFAKKENDDKRFMRGFAKKESDTEQQRKKREIRFNDQSDSDLLNKLVDAEESDHNIDQAPHEFDELWYDSPAFPREMSNEKRFMKGLHRYSKRDPVSDDDNTDRWYNGVADVDISKRFMRGLLRYYDSRQQAMAPKRVSLSRVTSSDRSPSYNKRFMRGYFKRDGEQGDSLDFDKRFIKGLDIYAQPSPGKRFIHGLESYYSQDSPFSQDKRFMRGFENYDKRFMRGLENYSKRSSFGDSLNFPELNNGVDKRFMHGYKRDDDKRFMRGFDKRFIVGYYRHLVPRYPSSQFHPSTRSSQPRSPFQRLKTSYDPKRDLALLPSPLALKSPGIGSRRFMAWRNGEFVQG